MTFWQTRLVALCALLYLGIAGGWAQEIQAARVNGVGIGLRELEAGFEDMLKDKGLHLLQVRNPAKVKQMKHEVLDRLIDEELLWQEAAKTGQVADERAVDAAFAAAVESFKGEEKLRLKLAQEEISEAEYRERIRRKLSAQRYAGSATAAESAVSDQDIHAFYVANPDKFHRPEMAHARHILIRVAPGASRTQRAQARRKAEGLLARLRAGAAFEEVAREHSEDATRQWGGELDPFQRGKMPPEFDRAVFALKPGALSGVVATAAGFHLIKLERRTPAMAISEQAARERIEGFLQETRQREALERLLERLRAAASIERMLPL